MNIARLPLPPFGFSNAAPHPLAFGLNLGESASAMPNPEMLAALGSIPGNTAKAHGRPFSTWLFFRLAEGTPEPAGTLQAFLKLCVELGWHTSLLQQLQDWRDYKEAKAAAELGECRLPDDHPVATRPFGNVLLTHRSFRWLDPKLERYGPFLLHDDSFAHGMVAQRHMLLDRFDASTHVPEDDSWCGYGFEEEFDLALLLARNTRAGCEELVAKAVSRAGEHGLTLVHQENGFVWQPDGENTKMREPFGFRDGLSNLLFLQEDVKEFRQTGATAWDPVSTWDRVLFAAPPRSDPMVQALEGGSFVVLRKLEQNVKALREWETKTDGPVADASGKTGEDKAARLIGRTRDGCPLTGLPASGRPNDFDYSGDKAGAKCPFHAHIRKANPRDSSGEPDERSRLFVRRGMIYAPNDRLDLTDRPGETSPDQAEKGVGLLFAGYMGSIDHQFRFMHSAWLTNPVFLHDARGDLDPLALPEWKSPAGGPGRLVVPRGGGYFFAPPLPWIHALAH